MGAMTPVTLLGLTAASAKSSRQAPARSAPDYASHRNQVARMEADRKAEARKSREELARERARHRAHFAARGLDVADGSAGAVLEGLKTRAQMANAERAQQAALERKTVDDRFAKTVSNNLLERKSSVVPDVLDTLTRWY